MRPLGPPLSLAGLALAGALAAAIADLKASGISAAAFYTDEFHNDEAATRAIFEFGARLGIETFSTGRPPGTLRAAHGLIRPCGIGLALHNASPGPDKHYVALEEVEAALARLPDLRACVDVGNFVRAGMDPVAAIRRLGDRIGEVHVKDVDAAGAHTLLGEGMIDLEALLNALEAIGFDGLLTLEHGGEPDDISKRLARLGENARRLHALTG